MTSGSDVPGNDARWIGPPISTLTVIAVLTICAIGSLISAVIPLLLDRLAQEGRLSYDQIGQTATMELIAMGLAAAAGGFWLRHTRLRLKMSAAATMFLLANLLTTYASGAQIPFLRLISGGCIGLFIWVLMGLFARSRLPARINGIFLGTQGSLALVTSILFTAFILPTFGSTGGFLWIVALSAVAIVAALMLPDAFAPLPASNALDGRPIGRSALFALGASYISLAAILAAWVYAPVLIGSQGYGREIVGVGVPLALGFEILGGFLSAAFAHLLSYRRVLIAVPLLFCAIIALWLTAPPRWVYIASFGLFGLLWMGMISFQFTHVVDVDPTRRAIAFLSSSQLLGTGSGPIIASLGVAGTDVRGAIYIALALFALWLGLFLASLHIKRLEQRRTGA